MKNKISFIPYADDVQYPTRGHKDDAGIDFYAPDDFVLVPQLSLLGRGHPTVVSLGFGICFPKRTLMDKLLNKHWHAEITQRSSQNLRGVIVMRGIIDEGYKGEIKCALVNLTPETVEYHKGDRIGQILFYKERLVNSPDITVLDKNERKTGGFGSTGK